MMPTEKTSHFEEYSLPVSISIGKYNGVPIL